MTFTSRHIGTTPDQLTAMAQQVGYSSVAELINSAVPAEIRAGALNLPQAISEHEEQVRLAALANMNFPGRSLIGKGFFGAITPAVLRRNILENPAWYTAYTPYQPEISQGRLEALLLFQTVVSDLTGLPIAGASLLDEPTAVAEGVVLARRSIRSGGRVIVDENTLPATLAVVKTRCEPLGIKVVTADLFADADLSDAFAVCVSVPGSDGRLPAQAELEDLAERAHVAGALVLAACDPLSLTLVSPPASWGADIAAGSMQRFGVPLFFGGPHAGYLAVRKGLERQLPGRLVGLSKDADGNPAIRLALQSREQHIRRERATSNICTSQVLLAVVAAMYAVYHGPAGLRQIGLQVSSRAKRLAAGLVQQGFTLRHSSFFDTLIVAGPASDLIAKARESGFHLLQVDDGHVGISIGEDVTEAELHRLAGVFGAELSSASWGDLAGHDRQLDFLGQPVFSAYRTETEMMRYLTTLAGRDLALDRAMIPLGSCTLKLNSATEMEPISYPGFANLHPYVPEQDSQGMRQLIAEVESWLAEVTGYDAVSIQPNAGSQGEYAGLMAIRSYHISRGDGQRNICLIPASAHGTNAASAVMAGLKVVVVKTAPDGSVDLEHLDACIEKHSDSLAAVMVTYPSTHGVFEDTITGLCRKVHDAGGQVYVDGANLNALMGLGQPGQFGGDASHLNLHKTFAIPHGGGGPGVGPICVKEHLAPFLPSHPEEPGRSDSFGPISGAPFGSAGVLPITHAYLAMCGATGLTDSSVAAIVSANYVAKRLSPAYPILYTGTNGLVAHECIVDIRPMTKETGVTVDDVAKRLIDYGFHAPTMSFPVPGTLMVEPTESESLAELDRFIDAMLSIADEAKRVARGEWPGDDNPLVNAPHPLSSVLASDWSHPYSRETAAFPAGRPSSGPLLGQGRDKYWPAASRIDAAYGDRNLFCTCPTLSEPDL